jgi:predicted ATPase with chaperone activity
VRAHRALNDAGRSRRKAAMAQLQLSARSYHRMLKLARTIANLAGEAHLSTCIWPKRCNTARG